MRLFALAIFSICVTCLAKSEDKVLSSNGEVSVVKHQEDYRVVIRVQRNGKNTPLEFTNDDFKNLPHLKIASEYVASLDVSGKVVALGEIGRSVHAFQIDDSFEKWNKIFSYDPKNASTAIFTLNKRGDELFVPLIQKKDVLVKKFVYSKGYGFTFFGDNVMSNVTKATLQAHEIKCLVDGNHLILDVNSTNYTLPPIQRKQISGQPARVEFVKRKTSPSIPPMVLVDVNTLKRKVNHLEQ